MIYPAIWPRVSKVLFGSLFGSRGSWKRAAAFAAVAAIALRSQSADADGSGDPPLTQQQLQQGYDDYVGQFSRLLAQPGLQLPQDAPKQGGKAIVSIVLAANGQLLSSKISQSSGYESIDQFALEDVRQTQYPPFNSRMPYKSYPFDLPITVAPPPPSGSTFSPQGAPGPGLAY